jgi:hypothetical protein
MGAVASVWQDYGPTTKPETLVATVTVAAPTTSQFSAIYGVDLPVPRRHEKKEFPLIPIFIGGKEFAEIFEDIDKLTEKEKKDR